MVIKVDSRDGETLRLGVQTSPDTFEAVAHWKASMWATARAKSYSLCLRNESYEGRPADNCTGYGTAIVRYYSRLSEGAHPVVREQPYPVRASGT